MEPTADDPSGDSDCGIVKSGFISGKPTNEAKSSDILDLSKRKLSHLTEEHYRNYPCLKNLHLQGNVLSSLPDSLFLYLPNLIWLDLRYNEITSLPGTIGKHRLLKYLLLEGNPIKALPVELGDLFTLKALNLRHCPLEFPPEDIVCRGLQSILSFLRNSRPADPVFSHPCESELPPMEKLDLKELMKSSLDLSNEDVKRQFEALKSKLEEKEMEEMVNNEPPLNKPQRMPGPGKSNGWKFLTESRRSEADKHTEEKERLALIHQKQRNQEILKDWQKQTKIMQEHKTRNKKKNQKQHEVPTALPPYATDLDPAQDWDKQKTLGLESGEMMPRIMSVKSLQEMEKARASRDLKLEHRIRQHIQTMQERKRNPKHSAQEEMEAARKELEMATLLQAEILQRKREQDTPLEYRLTAFTGEISPNT
ncbi:leucine-rich repeat-containing protein 27 [Hyperolius riggenbachi]|uniref:leucine-rich repeat-containing protein 27 n=1 Tax=Hyperolius riggenbachi TaxID=752182 RepID=UPI0035A2E5EA